MKKNCKSKVDRLLLVCAMGVFFLAIGYGGGPPRGSGTVFAAPPDQPGIRPGPVTLVDFDGKGMQKGTVVSEKVIKSEPEWKESLSPLAYEVTRRKGTELAFTGKFNKHYEKGVYRCAACGNALFSSDTKYDSGSGWPSFWAPMAEENLEVETDTSLGMVREEVLCKRCNAHLGHLFPDGPKPTNQRFCVNSAALAFNSADEAE